MEQVESYNVLTPGRYRHRNSIELVASGKGYFAKLNQLIRNARYSIHFQVYVFSNDETGSEIATSLIYAASKGVKVYLLVDGYASQNLPNQFIKNLTDAGVLFSRFEPLFKGGKFYFGRRLHHKVVVVDGIHAMVGGINVSDHYNMVNNVQAWYDLAVCINGEAASELEYICCKMWNSIPGNQQLMPQLAPLDKMQQIPVASVRVRRNDWVKALEQVWHSYAQLLVNAQEEIIIACSYFMPGWKFRKLMAKAVKRGVSIKVIVAGLSDVMLAKHAERFLYRWLLEKGISIFEYQTNILHAKVGIADKRRMTIGSYNINNISAYASIELNLDIRNKPFVSMVANRLNELIAHDCLEVTLQNYRTSYRWPKRLWQKICFETVKILLYLFTFYFKREKAF